MTSPKDSNCPTVPANWGTPSDGRGLVIGATFVAKAMTAVSDPDDKEIVGSMIPNEAAIAQLKYSLPVPAEN